MENMIEYNSIEHLSTDIKLASMAVGTRVIVKLTGDNLTVYREAKVTRIGPDHIQVVFKDKTWTVVFFKDIVGFPIGPPR